MNRIWHTVRSLSSRSCGASTSLIIEPEALEIGVMQEEFVGPDIGLGATYMEPTTKIEVDNPMKGPFSWGEFSAASSAFRMGKALGLDGISYEVVRGFSEHLTRFLLTLFNSMFQVSSFPESWRNALVVFIAKLFGGGGGRPVSLTSTLCKTLERLVQRRLEFLSEHLEWVPRNQYGSRGGMSHV